MHEAGYYWIRINDGDWEIAQVTTTYDKNYIWTCGWEVPIEPSDIIWGPKLVSP